jgi:hypothetical protein
VGPLNAYTANNDGSKADKIRDSMPDSELPVSKVRRRGAEPSLIESFGIDGLYGYRSISLESEYAATILIAKNGTGKTTLLGALDAFLRLQLSRLRNLEFTKIR